MLAAESEDWQHKVQQFPKHFVLISGFVHAFGSELSSTFPMALIYVILSFYGTTIDIINKMHGYRTTTILMRLKKGHLFNFYFNNIKIKEELTIGIVELCYQPKNILYHIPSFAGLILRKDMHWFYTVENEGAYYYRPKIKESTNFSIKISLDFKEYIKASYAINDNQFPNQFMYRPQKSAIGKEILSSPSIQIFDKPKNRDQFLVIQLYDYNDSISITNITKN